MGLASKIIITTVALGAAAYTFETIRRQSVLIQNTEIRVHGMKVKLNNTQQATISGLLELNNKSALTFTINSYNFDVSLNDTSVGSISASPKFAVDRNSVKDYPFSVVVNPLTVLGEASDFTGISDLLDSMLSLKGSYIVNNSWFFARIPLDVSYKLRDLI